ncbi:MAG TPA: AI-2E family transporter [Ktedonobacterales bacterium]
MDISTQPPVARESGAPPADASSASRRFSISITARSLWLAALIVVVLVVGAVIVVKALSTVILLLLAIILGEAIRPLVARLQRHRIPGPLAILLIYVVGLGIAAVLLWILLGPLIQEVNSLASNLPNYTQQVQQWASQLQEQLRAQSALAQTVSSISRALGSLAQQVVPALIAVPIAVVSGIFSLFISLVVILTMTLFWLTSTARLKPFVVGLFSTPEQERVGKLIGEIGQGFGGYVRGTLISMVLIGLLTGVGLLLLGVPYALLLGMLAALTELLPYLGPWISGTVAVLVALITVDPFKAVQVVILFILIQEIEGNVVQPLVMSRAVHVDPLLVIVSVLVGINVLGIIGAVLAIPIVAAIQIVIVRVLAPMARQAARAREAALVAGTDVLLGTSAPAEADITPPSDAPPSPSTPSSTPTAAQSPAGA